MKNTFKKQDSKGNRLDETIGKGLNVEHPIVKRTQIEWDILIGLFKATVEQQNMLVGEPKQLTKVIFKRWINEGNKLLDLIEKESDMDFLEEFTGVIEDSINELRTNKIKR